MAFGGSGTTRGHDLGNLFTTVFEWLGLLNKGSSDAPAAPDPNEMSQVTSVSSNTLNVTRVGGLAALVTAVGAAAIALFNVDKAKDPHTVVAAAYASVGVIVAAALVTAGIIVVADIRARGNVAAAVTPSASPAQRDVTVIHGAATTQVTADITCDYTLLDATKGNIEVLLPDPAGATGRMIAFTRLDANRDHNASLHGVAGQDTVALTHDQKTVQVYSSGTDWRRL